MSEANAVAAPPAKKKTQPNYGKAAEQLKAILEKHVPDGDTRRALVKDLATEGDFGRGITLVFKKLWDRTK